MGVLDHKCRLEALIVDSSRSFVTKIGLLDRAPRTFDDVISTGRRLITLTDLLPENDLPDLFDPFEFDLEP